MAELDWGVKRTCGSCASRFYDLRKTSPSCPKCGASFDLHVTSRSRKKNMVLLKDLKESIDDSLDLPLADADIIDDAVPDGTLLEEDEALDDDFVITEPISEDRD